LPTFGAVHARMMSGLPHLQVIIALMRDGFHPESPGGTVALQSDGTPVLDYPLNGYFWNGARRAFSTMAEIQFAAGARTVIPLHAAGASFASWRQAQAAIGAMALAPQVTPVVSAHVMGGCPLGSDAKRAAVDATGRYHQLENMYVLDGSLFPTSLGANPQLSIYGITAKLASTLAARLGYATRGGD
jgi:choline dehydrogenase-like flavoprotein